jgi:hypothetical protein
VLQTALLTMGGIAIGFTAAFAWLIAVGGAVL